MNLWRWVGVMVVALVGVYAWRAGAFSASAYRKLELAEAEELLHLQRLRHEVDSMKAFRDSLMHDPRVKERVAREHWGMIRPGEISILIGKGDSAARDSARR